MKLGRALSSFVYFNSVSDITISSVASPCELSKNTFLERARSPAMASIPPSKIPVYGEFDEFIFDEKHVDVLNRMSEFLSKAS